MQWLQSSIAVFYTDFYGISLKSIFGGPELVEATWLSLIGVLVLAIGMRLALVRPPLNAADEAQRESQLLEPANCFMVYLLSVYFFYELGKRAGASPALQQPLLALSTVRWVMVFLLAYAVLQRRKLYSLLAITIALEAGVGFLGYFSGFRSVFFLLLVVLPTARFAFKGWRLVQLILVASVLLVLSIVWTSIKMEYREFLNQGTGQQEVLVPVPQRIDKLKELVGGLNRESFKDGLEKVILRVSYVNYFALTIMNVPEAIPYEKGALWLGTIKHVLMPRLFFPNKPAINDSERTAYYTGVQVAGEEQGTSISIGYMGESYIDFGPAGMFMPIVLLGFFYGLIYRFFVYHYRFKVLGFAMATSILVFGAYNLETSNIKLFGGNLMSLMVMGSFSLVAGGWLWRMITNPTLSSPRRWRRRTGARFQPPNGGAA